MTDTLSALGQFFTGDPIENLPTAPAMPMPQYTQVPGTIGPSIFPQQQFYPHMLLQQKSQGQIELEVRLESENRLILELLKIMENCKNDDDKAYLKERIDAAESRIISAQMVLR